MVPNVLGKVVEKIVFNNFRVWRKRLNWAPSSWISGLGTVLHNQLALIMLVDHFWQYQNTLNWDILLHLLTAFTLFNVKHQSVLLILVPSEWCHIVRWPTQAVQLWKTKPVHKWHAKFPLCSSLPPPPAPNVMKLYHKALVPVLRQEITGRTSIRLTVLLLCLFCYMPNYLFGSAMFNTVYICKLPWVFCLYSVSQKNSRFIWL